MSYQTSHPLLSCSETQLESIKFNIELRLRLWPTSAFSS